MRITPNISADSALYNIQQGRAKLDKLQELISSGSNVNRPSDDPIASRVLLDIGDKLKATDQYASNITKASTWLQFTSTALQGMADTMQLAKQQVATITSGNSDPTIRQTVVSQLQALKQQMIDMGNTQMGDQYLFGGAKNAALPFSSVSPYYSGDETATSVEIAQSTTQQMNIPGNQILTADTAVSQPYGSTNILKAFDDLIAAVGSDNVAGIQAGAKTLESGAQQITNAQSDVASRQIRLDSSSKMNANNKNALETIAGNIQNVDYAKLAVEMTQQQTAFQASLSATAKVTQLSLLDYL